MVRTTGEPDTIDKSHVKHSKLIKFVKKENRDEAVYTERLIQEINKEYRKERTEHPELPESEVYKIARDHVYKRRGLTVKSSTKK
jgi:hypothetical protein